MKQNKTALIMLNLSETKLNDTDFVSLSRVKKRIVKLKGAGRVPDLGMQMVKIEFYVFL